MTTQSFECPSCGGPLEYDGGGSVTVRCPFCTNTVIVPEELRESGAGGRVQPSLIEQAGKLAEIGRLIRGGNKIAAIKVYRETFGVGLKEAKDAVERLAEGKPVNVAHARVEMSGLQPQAFQSPAQGWPQGARRAKGCSPLALALVIFVLIIAGVGLGIYFIASSAIRTATTSHAPVPVTRPATGSRQTSDDSSEGGFARVALKFGSEGIGAGQFKDARSVAVDGEGHIYAADYTGGRVQVFDANGKFLTQWMIDAKMPLLRLAADRKGTVYIVQSGDINRYEGMTGKSLGKVPATGRWFNDVTVTADGGLVAVQNGQDIVRFDASGRTLSVIKEAITAQSGDSELDGQVAVDGLGNIYEMGTFNGAVFKFAPNGKFINRIGGKGEEPGQFRALQSIAVDGQGRIYVSDTKGIQVFDENGRYLDVFKVERGIAFGMVFNDKKELFVAARTSIVKFVLTAETRP